MSTMTFDKLTYVDSLKAAGIPDGQARAMAEGLDKALREEVATKSFVAEQLAPLKTDVAVLKWMMGFALAVLVAIALKTFLH